ncbi:helix-turn-helix transcriptional regulator [Aureimonas sp. OT7]|uniref:TetR/AcrR family transcriptional regulator n=1 Tax=Aureimonas sp. OT7 TaxID=2816454 RepID=UPI00177CA765|nr:TetR/AcrR family transcriptional regulator [Aureimonas sp. OT7]QOG06566.1 helix-turn-helix transcriptional regulator [Aureimonas sp. OT7]
MAKRPSRGEGLTRHRILEAAIRRFGTRSFDDVSLRDIAADVAVDVAYVHRSYGSKEKLFLEALEAASEEMNFSDLAPQDLPAYLVQRIFDQPRGKLVAEINAFDILISSASSPHVSSFLAQRMQDEFFNPLAEKLQDRDGSRVAMMIALLLGFGVLRDFLKLPMVTAMGDAQAEAVLTQSIRQVLNTSGASEAEPIDE